jgi:hypothetical protein
MTNSAAGTDIPILPPFRAIAPVLKRRTSCRRSGVPVLPMCVYVENAIYAAMMLDEHYILLFCILRYWCSPAERVSIPR